MKKIVYCLLAMLFSIFCFSACGDNSKNSAGNTDSQPAVAFVNNEITIAVGESAQVEVVTAKKNMFVFWTIRDENIATISPEGVITGLEEGQTICWAEVAGEKAVCMVKVTEKQAVPMLSISIPYEKNNVMMYAGDTLDLKVVVKAGDVFVDNAQVAYDVNTDDVVSVENGVLTAIAEGRATITITANYQNQSAFLLVNVQVTNKA